MEEIYIELSVRQELVPEIVGEHCIDASKDGKKVCFEFPDGAFGVIASVHIRGQQLLIFFPLPLDGLTILLDGFIF